MYYYYPVRRRRSLKPWLFSLILVVLAAFGAWKVFALDEPFTLSGTTTKILGVFKPQPINPDTLGLKLKPYLEEFARRGWRIGLAVYDFKTKSSYNLNSTEVFEAASLTKLPVLLTAFDRIERGELNLNQMIEVRADQIHDYGTSVLQYHGPGTKYSLQDLLWYMANRSDNTSFQVLIDLLGTGSIEKNLHDWGFQTTSITDNETTPRGMMRMFDLIYNHKLIEPSFNNQMMMMLVETNDESRIPAGVSKEINVIHKTGNAIGGLQDAGVVELPDRPYEIAILTDNVDDEVRATELEAQISKVVFDYIKSL